jgi:hypothetical protein
MLRNDNAVAKEAFLLLELLRYVLFCRPYIITDPVAVAGCRDFGSLHDVVLPLYMQA